MVATSGGNARRDVIGTRGTGSPHRVGTGAADGQRVGGPRVGSSTPVGAGSDAASTTGAVRRAVPRTGGTAAGIDRCSDRSRLRATSPAAAGQPVPAHSARACGTDGGQPGANGPEAGTGTSGQPESSANRADVAAAVSGVASRARTIRNRQHRRTAAFSGRAAVLTGTCQPYRDGAVPTTRGDRNRTAGPCGPRTADRLGGQWCPWYPCTTAWPRPRAIIHRFTGVVSRKATTSEPASEPQNRALVSPASMAPGTATTKALSMISMTRIDTVSAASATLSASRRPTPARSTPRMVRA